MIIPGQLVMLISPKGKRYFRKFDPAASLNTHDGRIEFAEYEGIGFGEVLRSHLGKEYRILKPTLYDLIKSIKRKTQIIYPKEIGYILLKLGIGPGTSVIEAGSGSGGLTMALAWHVGLEGKVYTYERRPEFLSLCKENLAAVGLLERVDQIQKDISEGFDQTGVDALFLDVRTPWEYLDQVNRAVISGGAVGFLLPTTNQVSDLLSSFDKDKFQDIEVLEILLRRYKPVADRLRPDDRMVAHTGYLVFARSYAS